MGYHNSLQSGRNTQLVFITLLEILKSVSLPSVPQVYLIAIDSWYVLSSRSETTVLMRQTGLVRPGVAGEDVVLLFEGYNRDNHNVSHQVAHWKE